MTSIFASLNDLSEYIFSSVPFNLKSMAFAPGSSVTGSGCDWENEILLTKRASIKISFFIGNNLVSFRLDFKCNENGTKLKRKIKFRLLSFSGQQTEQKKS